MKRMLIKRAQVWALLLCLLLPPGVEAAQFVGLTVEFETSDWDYMFFSNRLGKYPGEAGTPSIFTENQTRRCVIGADTWMIESTLPTFRVTRWFTGTNIIEYTIITKQMSDEAAAKLSERSGLAVSAPQAGHGYTWIFDSVDGNPGRPGGVADLMGFDVPARASWLAFCSGPTLRREGRRIFPPSPMWKESSIAYSGWSDSTEVFKDGLGVPRSMNLLSTNGQSIFRYQVHQSTNVLGWTIPLEFYGVQYLPSASNTWKLHLTFKGRVTSIGRANQPEIPGYVMEVIEK